MNDVIQWAAGAAIFGASAAGLWRVVSTGTSIARFLERLDGSVTNLGYALKVADDRFTKMEKHFERIALMVQKHETSIAVINERHRIEGMEE